MKLTQARYEAFARLSSEIDTRIERACELYNSLLEEAGISKFADDILWHNGTTYLDYMNNGIELQWSVTWSYGGQASGSNDIPMECLLDDIWEKEVIDRANEIISKYKTKKQAKVKREDDTDREEFIRLKAKFEGDENV